MLAPLGRDAELACAMLSEAGLACRFCRSIDDLRTWPIESCGALLLTEEVLAENAVRTLLALLDAQPAWSNLPVTIFTGRSRQPPAGRGLAEALSSRQGIIFLERPVRVATFTSVMRSAVLARRRQYELRDQLVARQKAEAHARMLAEEMKHRIKNSLALVGAIALQTFKSARPVEESLEAFSFRLKAMALAQDVLTRDDGDGTPLHQLVSRALAPYEQHDNPGRIAISGPDVWIGGRSTTSLTMAMHELATNAVKYGALSLDAGHIAIGWRIEEASGGRHLHIEWREHDGPAVVPPKRRGFGSRLVERGLATELGGRASIVFDPQGIVCTITASLGMLG